MQTSTGALLANRAQSFLKKIKLLLLHHLPLVLLILIASYIALVTIKPNTSYTGWDNLLTEFNFPLYSQRILTGAWIEHQGTGAPMSLAHLVEVPRLLQLQLLHSVLPSNLVRISYLMVLYLVGGVTMYAYLYKIWLKKSPAVQRSWLAGLGGLLYLLHILTLQQFYIIFELFAVQFAFLPLLLLVLHRFEKKLSAQTVFVFGLVQLLLAPSGHTPTVFYLAVLISQLYAFFILLPKGLVRAVWTGFLVGVLTFFFNSYWIIPNLYYSINDSHYVSESVANELFAPEALASIKEAATWQNILQNKQYLFEWKDYTFSTRSFEFIFNEWQAHLSNPFVVGILILIGILTLFGFVTALFDTKKSWARWPVLITFLVCFSFIWMGALPSKYLFDWLAQSDTFLEAFRNPFTKLSVIYSVVSVILFVGALDWLGVLANKVVPHKKQEIFVAGISSFMAVLIIISAWPSFRGKLVSEKLQVTYPDQYQELFTFLKTLPNDQRLLQLPQTSHEGWEYFDWQFLGDENGYQGMGFLMFGAPQPVMHRDTDRWVESSDFFFHELKYALNNNDQGLFETILNKYYVELLLVDKTRIEPSLTVDFERQHQLARQSGFSEVWHDEFLTLYQRDLPAATTGLIFENSFTTIDADSDRVGRDLAYAKYGTFISENSSFKTASSFPFINLIRRHTDLVRYTDTGIAVSQPVSTEPDTEYVITIPALEYDHIPVATTYRDDVLELVFPKLSLTVGDRIYQLPSLENQVISVPEATEAASFVFGDRAVLLQPNETRYPLINYKNASEIPISFFSEGNETSGFVNINTTELIPLGEIPVSNELRTAHSLVAKDFSELTLNYEFPEYEISLNADNIQNCSQPERGRISAVETAGSVTYGADEYAVNCSGTRLNEQTNLFSYILRMEGENTLGRGIKLFLNRLSPGLIPESFVYDQNSFNDSYTVLGLPNQDEIRPNLNWEVRSFGDEVESRIDAISTRPVPLEQMAGIEVKPLDATSTTQNLEGITSYSLLGLVKVVSLNCESESCLIGWNQSFDDAWIGFSSTSKTTLEHVSINNWANGWLIQSGRQTLYIFYLPQIVATFCYLAVGMTILILSIIINYNSMLSKKNQKDSLQIKIKKNLYS